MSRIELIKLKWNLENFKESENLNPNQWLQTERLIVMLTKIIKERSWFIEEYSRIRKYDFMLSASRKRIYWFYWGANGGKFKVKNSK